MRGLKVLLYTATLLVSLFFVPTGQAQISINLGVPPVCSYGYYDYPPYSCAPVASTDRVTSTTASFSA